MRIGEAAGLHLDDLDLENGVIHVRRSVWNGSGTRTPRRRTPCAKSTSIRRSCRSSCGSTSGRVDEHASSKRATGAPLSAGSIRNRILHPLLAKLGIPKAGLHAFRHSRVTLLRKNGTPADLQRQWIGHSSLKTTDQVIPTPIRNSDSRRKAASRVGLDLIVGPNEHAAALAAVAVNVILGTFQATGKATLGVREVSVAVGTRIENVPVRRWPHWIRRGPKRQHAMSTSAIKVLHTSWTQRRQENPEIWGFRANRTRRSVTSARLAKLLILS